MIRDPGERGRKAAALYASVAPGLFRDLEESGLLPPADRAARERARQEWECFALYACVRALVAGGGFGAESGRALDAFHEAVLEQLRADCAGEAELESRRARIAQRYQEYGELGQKESRGGDPRVARALGLAAAARMLGAGEAAHAPGALGELVGSLHDALLEGVQQALEGGG